MGGGKHKDMTLKQTKKGLQNKIKNKVCSRIRTGKKKLGGENLILGSVQRDRLNLQLSTTQPVGPSSRFL